LENLGEETVQLRERHWRIFSLSGTLETVRGRGIIGKVRNHRIEVVSYLIVVMYLVPNIVIIVKVRNHSIEVSYLITVMYLIPITIVGKVRNYSIEVVSYLIIVMCFIPNTIIVKVRNHYIEVVS